MQYAPTQLAVSAILGTLAVFVLSPPILAFEPMPPIMQTLLEIFPEENGRFVDEPFGSTPEMPNEAKPLFETFRVVVPTVEDIEKNLARLFAASSQFPIKKITRYDKNPGAPGLAGFRGVWCQTEDENQVGFSIVTINQNRFLIWAKMGYYPAFGNDSINAKVRDQYARDVSQYLAGIDMKVPENEAPPASGRGLPEWMGLYRELDQEREQTVRDTLNAAADPEFHEWGITGCYGFIPTDSVMAIIISSANDSAHGNQDIEFFQDEFDRALEERPHVQPTAWKGDDLWGQFEFAIDRYGRMRYLPSADECGGGYVDISTLFPGARLLTLGRFSCTRLGENQPPKTWILQVSAIGVPYFISMGKPVTRDTIRTATKAAVESLGHFFALLKSQEIDFRDTLIRRNFR